VKSIALVLLLLMLWGVGLLAFAARVAQSTPAAPPGKAEGIVVLTGGSSQRIEAAMRLLRQGAAERLLISGVNRDATRADIRRVARAVAAPVYDCCVDLGFEAEDTIGNARETAAWARARDYDRLIVVTADYHMPRALLELHSAMPKAVLTPYPVATGELNARAWWRSYPDARRMALEYTKYLVILARETVLHIAAKDGAAKDGAAKDGAAKDSAAPAQSGAR
jgi:uncharacterized SAM-binding protein YcdF (DUF218 family)